MPEIINKIIKNLQKVDFHPELLKYKKLYKETQAELLKYKNLYEESQKEFIKCEIVENIKTPNKHILQVKNPCNLMQQVIKKEFDNQECKNYWSNSNFSLIDSLKNDYSGRVGEKYIKQICDEVNITNLYLDDKIASGGTFDILINEKKVEIKTARYGLSGSFQHESLRNKSSDYYLFTDIKPDYFYITIIPSFDLSNKCKIIERKPHLRKGTSDVYKFDFSENSILKSINKGFSIKITDSTNFDDIENFIKKRII